MKPIHKRAKLIWRPKRKLFVLHLPNSVLNIGAVRDEDDWIFQLVFFSKYSWTIAKMPQCYDGKLTAWWHKIECS